MALRLAGEVEGGGVREVIERINYSPGLRTTNDLEAATKAITATVEATGTGNADYSAALTITAPTDARLVILRVCARLQVTIDSATATSIRCRVYVDSQVAGNLLFDETWATTGAKLDAVDIHSGNLATIFNLLKNGAAHTFYFFFWVNSGNAVLSLVQVSEGVGSQDAATGRAVLQLDINPCMYSANAGLRREGTGTPELMMGPESVINSGTVARYLTASGHATRTQVPASAIICGATHYICIQGSVATDLNYLERLTLERRAES